MFQEMSLFSDVNISQGSVSMPLRCGRICTKNFVANLLMNLAVQVFFENRLRFGEVMDKSLLSWFFDSQFT